MRVICSAFGIRVSFALCDIFYAADFFLLNNFLNAFSRFLK